MIKMFYKIRVLLSIINFMCLNKDSAGLIISLFKMNIDSMSLINVSTNNNTNSSLIKIDSMGLNITTWNNIAISSCYFAGGTAYDTRISSCSNKNFKTSKQLRVCDQLNFKIKHSKTSPSDNE